ncbi:MAG: hypothetical protein H7Y28_00830 [Rhodoferax sp.]|nr:hypothetical protein [Rhodoferax sp.]
MSEISMLLFVLCSGALFVLCAMIRDAVISMLDSTPAYRRTEVCALPA